MLAHSASEMRRALVPVALRPASKTTLPLFSRVRTRVKPRPSNTAFRSTIAIRFALPTLMPRNSAIWTAISDFQRCQVALRLQPLLPITRALFCEQHIHQRMRVLRVLDGQLHQAAGIRVDR